MLAMKTAFVVLAVLAVGISAIGQAPANTQADAHPEIEQLNKLADGVYYKQGDKYLSVDPLQMSGGGMKHVGKMFVPGLTPQMVWTYRGAEAPLRIVDPKPSFYVKRSFYMVNVPGQTYRDILIVKFEKKKDRRELQTSNGGNMVTFKAGIGKDKLPDIETEKLADNIFKLTPKEPLTVGEYLIAFGMANSGYDFGIDLPKK